ncbi:MAG: secretin N-terminal domain-containing protein [Opitutaceae bacterium]
MTQKSQETLSVDFPDEEIRVILRNIADLFELNLVVPDTLQGRSSLKLREVTWKQIFDVILSPVGFTYVEDGNIIQIVSQESLQVEPPVTEIFILSYARASEVGPTVTSMIDPASGGRIQIDNRSNALVITERPSQMSRIRPVIDTLDKATDQVMIETKFVEVSDKDLKNLGVNWASLDAYQVGVEGGLGDDGFHSFDRQNVNDVVTKTSLFSSVFSADKFSVILSALENNQNATLVSNPTVVTMNNTEAFISIGEQYPIPNYTYNQERGTFEVSGFEYKDIGILMRVTPQVNNEGLINLKIDPEVSSTNGSTSFGGAGGAEIPIIAVRKTTTNVALKDGYTMGLGGLIESLSQDKESKVPVLGDIPGLGRLFRSDTKDNSSRNLVIFITARILPPEGSTYKDVFDPRQIRDMGLTPEDIPGYKSNVDPFAQASVTSGGK